MSGFGHLGIRRGLCADFAVLGGPTSFLMLSFQQSNVHELWRWLLTASPAPNAEERPVCTCLSIRHSRTLAKSAEVPVLGNVGKVSTVCMGPSTTRGVRKKILGSPSETGKDSRKGTWGSTSEMLPGDP